MQLNLVDTKQSLEVSDDAFGQAFNESLVHQVVTAYMSGGRAGTHAQKTRSEVRGGGKKPWKQKGTGRARAGTSRSPIWRSGGVTFAAKPRDYSQKVNRKMYRAAIRSILSELVRKERLLVVDSLGITEPKTKAMIEALKKISLVEHVLIIVDEMDENTYFAARNLRNVELIDAKSIDPVSLVKYQHVLMTAKAIKKVEEFVA